MTRACRILERLNLDYSTGTYVTSYFDYKSICSLIEISSRINRFLLYSGEYYYNQKYQIIDADEFHVTLSYSKSKFNPDLSDIYPINDIKIKDVELFGKDKDTLVLTLESPKLTLRNKELVSLGAVSDFDLYRPHVTLFDKIIFKEDKDKDFESLRSMIKRDFFKYTFSLTSESVCPIK